MSEWALSTSIASKAVQPAGAPEGAPAAVLFIRGQAEFGVITQSSMAFSHVLGAFSLIVTQFQQISSYAVVLARLGALIESVEQVAARGASGIAFDEGEELAWEHLTLRSPHDSSLLVDALSLSLPAGTRTLVTGANEAGRIALFRATAGSERRRRPHRAAAA